MSGFSGGRHDYADGGDCASWPAGEAEKAIRQQLARDWRVKGSIRTRVRGGLEEADATRGSWANKTNKIEKKSPLRKDLKRDWFGRKQRRNRGIMWGEGERGEGEWW